MFWPPCQAASQHRTLYSLEHAFTCITQFCNLRINCDCRLHFTEHNTEMPLKWHHSWAAELGFKLVSSSLHPMLIQQYSIKKTGALRYKLSEVSLYLPSKFIFLDPSSPPTSGSWFYSVFLKVLSVVHGELSIAISSHFNGLQIYLSFK